MSLDVDDEFVVDDNKTGPALCLPGLDEAVDTKVVKNPSDELTVAGALGAIACRDMYADCYFLCGSGREQRRVPAHRIVLAASSDVFEAMLYPLVFPEDEKTTTDKAKIEETKTDSAKLSEKEVKKDTSAKSSLPCLEKKDDVMEIELPTVKPVAFRLMLQCVYGDSANIRAEDLPELIGLAKRFNLESVRMLCLQFMEEGVTVDNACTMFENAEKLLGDPTIALPFIEGNALEVFNSAGFDTLSKARLMYLLKSDRLGIDEIDVYKAVLRWGSVECRRQGMKDIPDNKKKVLKDVVQLVRFPLMTMEEIATNVSPTQMLSPEQMLDLFTYVGRPETSKKNKIKSQFPTKPRTGAVDKWSLDPTFKSSSLTLSNNNMTCALTSGSYSAIVGTVSWTKGQHAWRVTRDTGGTQWMILGVSKYQSHQDQSYSCSDVWAISGSNQSYYGGTSGSCTSNLSGGPLDCLLDCDAGSFAIINLSNSQRMDFTVPKNQPLCPHFGPYSTAQITVKPIRVKDFGKKSS
eukprot:TRINITY_DN10348_c0_g1_i1.p1 TRINITY_DN10348_c0_g1~~TRINITY_DN10348_c0_g1_i1.p1  ORF type:complete len:520 (+),score=134.05 TRINITY_DN10348_c0_g1_i1:85-1644(+)